VDSFLNKIKETALPSACDGMSQPMSSTLSLCYTHIAEDCFVCMLFCNLLFSLIPFY